MSDSLFDFVQSLKEKIVCEADGKDADVLNIRNKDDLEAANRVMLAPGTGQGKRLFQAINTYRKHILSMLTDPQQKAIIAENLTTRLPRKAHTMGRNWQEYMFEDMPVAAAVTLLSKLQSDIRYAEGEVLHTLVAEIDIKDIRVNKLQAFVIPESRTVVSGDQFAARIVMAAVDTTRQPEIYIGGRRMNLPGGLYRFATSGIGEHSFGGVIAMQTPNGGFIRRPFVQKYTVVAPSATVSADLMNVLYAGFDNPLSVSIPGVPLSNVSIRVAGSAFREAGKGHFVVHPTVIGRDVTITVLSTQDNRSREVGRFTFHVRKLPDPTAYIQIGTDRFRGGALYKGALVGAQGIKAAIDDGILDIDFRVTGFESVFFDNMGNAVPMTSNGALFSDRQRDALRRLARGRRFYISHITAVGPDGITRRLPASMEVIVK